MYAVAITVTAASDKDTEVYTGDIELIQENQGAGAVYVDDGSPGSNSMRFAAANSAIDTYSTTLPSTLTTGFLYVNTNFCTALHHIDFGSNVIGVVRETTAAQGSHLVGFVSMSIDDLAAIHLAVREKAAITATIKDILGRGFIPFAR
jgi:hypothetical protein